MAKTLITIMEESILFFKLIFVSFLNVLISFVKDKAGMTQLGISLTSIGAFLMELVSYIPLAVPVLIGLVRLYREFMLASDEHKNRKKVFGRNYKPKIGDFMRLKSDSINSADTGGTGGDDKDKKPGSGGNTGGINPK